MRVGGEEEMVIVYEDVQDVSYIYVWTCQRIQFLMFEKKRKGEKKHSLLLHFVLTL